MEFLNKFIISRLLLNNFCCYTFIDGCFLILKLMKQQSYKKKPSPSKTPIDRQNSCSNVLSKLRTSQLKFDQRSSDLFLLRNSYSSVAMRNFNQAEQPDFRHSNAHNLKKNQFESLKSTLTQLQDRVNAAKQQLHIPTNVMKKKVKPTIHFQSGSESKQKIKQVEEPNPTDSSITLKNSDKKLAALITNIPKPKNFKPMYTNPYSPRRHNTYYVSEAVRAVNQKNSLILQHINASIRIIKDCQQEIPSLEEIQSMRLSLKKKQEYKKKKTLVLDLDETLIHCVDNYQTQADLRLSIKLENQQYKSHHFGINIRPYAMTFLKKMAKKFQIIIFTASQQSYADAILDELDCDNEIFQHRLYRQHCFVLDNQLLVKDLRIINRNLSEIVLVDNAAYSYAFQLQNGIPILPFYQGSDYELSALESYLDMVEQVDDVRELNKYTFKLHHYTKFSSSQELVEQLYMNGHF